jgi:hypothetical protein
MHLRRVLPLVTIVLLAGAPQLWRNLGGSEEPELHRVLGCGREARS